MGLTCQPHMLTSSLPFLSHATEHNRWRRSHRQPAEMERLTVRCMTWPTPSLWTAVGRIAQSHRSVHGEGRGRAEKEERRRRWRGGRPTETAWRAVDDRDGAGRRITTWREVGMGIDRGHPRAPYTAEGEVGGEEERRHRWRGGRPTETAW
jgi:hypothetical protein